MAVKNNRRPLYELLEAQQYQDRYYQNIHTPNEIASVTKRLNVSQKYRLSMSPVIKTDGTTKSNIYKQINEVGQQYVHGIIMSNSSAWVFITQLEIYYKDKDIDDCSDNAVVSENPSGHHRIIIEQKGDKRKCVEFKICFGIFEVLMTGGIDGEVVSAFLGSSAPKSLYKENHWLAYIPVSHVKSIACIRLLRDFTRRDSLKRWAFKSRHFIEQVFETFNVLLYTSNKTCYYSIASLLIRLSSQRNISAADIRRCQKMLREIRFWNDLGLQSTYSQHDLKEAWQKNTKMGVQINGSLKQSCSTKEKDLLMVQ